MKKIIILLLVFTVTGMTFAQNFDFHGIVMGGFGFFVSDHKDSEMVLGNYTSVEGLGVVAQLMFDLSNNDNTVGLRLMPRVAAQPNQQGQTNSSNFSMEVYEGYLKFFDNMFEVRGGKLDNKAPYNPNGGIEAHMSNGIGMGTYFNANPMRGLNIRLGISPANGLHQAESFKEARYNLGFRYDLPSISNFFLNAAMHHEDVYDIGFGFQITLLKLFVPGLNDCNFDFAVLNMLESKDYNAGIQIGQRVNYTTGNFGTGIRFVQFLVEGREPDLTFAGHLQYLLGQYIVSRLNLGLNIGSGIRSPGQPGPQGDIFHSGNYNYYESINKGRYYNNEMELRFELRGGNKNAANLMIQPAIQFRYNVNQFIELGYAMQKDLSEKTGARTMNNFIFFAFKAEV